MGTQSTFLLCEHSTKILFLVFTLTILFLAYPVCFFPHWRTNSIMTVQVKADEFWVELLFLQNVLSSLYLANIYLTPLLTNSWKRKSLQFNTSSSSPFTRNCKTSHSTSLDLSRRPLPKHNLTLDFFKIFFLVRKSGKQNTSSLSYAKNQNRAWVQFVFLPIFPEHVLLESQPRHTAARFTHQPCYSSLVGAVSRLSPWPCSSGWSPKQGLSQASECLAANEMLSLTEILSLTAQDKLFSDATSPQWRFCVSLVVIISVAVNQFSCNSWVRRLFSKAEHGQASQGLAQEVAGREHLPHSHLSASGRGCPGVKWAVSRPWELAFSLCCGQNPYEGNGRRFQPGLLASPWAGSQLGQWNKPCAIRSWLVWGDACARATEQSAGQQPAHAGPEPLTGNWDRAFFLLLFF